MAKRSISDREISLIKAMLDRKMKNKDIQFFFNRPDRPVNTGRISGIDDGTYSNSAEIPTASDEELEHFLADFAAPRSERPLPEAADDGPLSNRCLHDLFEQDREGVWRFRHGESDCHECKESFGFKHSDKWLRAIAALANNKGGYILFGVRDKSTDDGAATSTSYKVVGLSSSEFANADVVSFTKQIKAIFDPTPQVTIRVIEIGGMSVGVIHVSVHPSRPIIATKAEGNIKEGDILFRYAGQSARIKYSDLRALLDERDRQARTAILPMVAELIRLGPQKALITDLERGSIHGAGVSLQIEEGLLDQIKFIKEGQFKDSGGDPTLRLMGDVQAVRSSGEVVRRGFVTPSDLVRDFLDLCSPYDPAEYVRCAVEGGNGAWLPIHYFGRKAKMSRAALANFILGADAPTKRKETYRDRAMCQVSAFRRAEGNGAAVLKQLLKGEVPEVADLKSATSSAFAVTALTKQPPLELGQLLTLMRRCKEIVEGSAKSGPMSVVRRAIARLDELYYSDELGD
jgi:hypothetical protein